MNPIAQFSPYDYYRKLMDLQVPGYEGYPGGAVAISSYVSANAMFGGNSNAATLSLALQKIVRNKPEAGLTQTASFSRVFTGQGSPGDFISAMSIINKYKDEFKAEPSLAKYFREADFLQAMANGTCFGLDCIGFVGTYLVDAGVESSYVGRRPLDFAASFKPVQSLDQIKDLAVVMLTSGSHIQIIDVVTERGKDSITVDLCQSSSGGPQCNVGVTIRGGGGDYLPVEKFRAAVASKEYAQEHADDNAARQREGKKTRDYETYLRAKLTEHNVVRGYGSGTIFQLFANGEPKNPVGGSVYVGVAQNGLKVKT
jgi:hypothetical protein